MSKLGWFNALFFQWFFVRLAVMVERIDGVERIIKLGFIYPIVPLTGWWSNFIFIGTKRSFWWKTKPALK